MLIPFILTLFNLTHLLFSVSVLKVQLHCRFKGKEGYILRPEVTVNVRNAKECLSKGSSSFILKNKFSDNKTFSFKLDFQLDSTDHSLSWFYYTMYVLG